MTVETKGWCLDNKNCSLSMQYLILFRGYKLVGCGSHKNTLLKSVCYAYRKFSDGLSNCCISTVAKDTDGFWQLRCRAYKRTNFGSKTSFWPLSVMNIGLFRLTVM